MLYDLIETETVAATVDAAVDLALERFACTRAEIDSEILQIPSRGFLGLIGRRPARVRVRLIDRGYIARRICEHLLERSGFTASVTVHSASERIELHIEGDESSRIIGRRGQTLDALQSLTVTLTDRNVPDRTPIVLDVDNYRSRRADSLRQLARRLSAQVRRSGRPATVQPLPPEERRIVHLTLEDEPGIETRSIGHGFERKMLVSSRRG